MNRVYKRFLSKILFATICFLKWMGAWVLLGTLIGGVVYLMFGIPQLSLMAGIFMPVFGTICFVCLHDVYIDAKREVTAENDKILKVLNRRW